MTELLNTNRAEVRAAMRWWRGLHPQYPSAKPIKHPFSGWVVWVTEGEAGYVDTMREVITAYRDAKRSA